MSRTTEPLTLAEALSVALDHADATGELPESLKLRIFHMLPGMKLASWWATPPESPLERVGLRSVWCRKELVGIRHTLVSTHNLGHHDPSYTANVADAMLVNRWCLDGCVRHRSGRYASQIVARFVEENPDHPTGGIFDKFPIMDSLTMGIDLVVRHARALGWTVPPVPDHVRAHCAAETAAAGEASNG